MNLASRYSRTLARTVSKVMGLCRQSTAPAWITLTMELMPAAPVICKEPLRKERSTHEKLRALLVGWGFKRNRGAQSRAVKYAPSPLVDACWGRSLAPLEGTAPRPSRPSEAA